MWSPPQRNPWAIGNDIKLFKLIECEKERARKGKRRNAKTSESALKARDSGELSVWNFIGCEIVWNDETDANDTVETYSYHIN